MKSLLLIFVITSYNVLGQGMFTGPQENWGGEDSFRGKSLTNGYYNNFFSDVDGDGKADGIAMCPDGVWVVRSSGNGFMAQEHWAAAPTWASHSADVNGDGKADLIGANKDYVYVALSTGNSFGSWTQWANVDEANVPLRIFAGDVTGDGKADLVYTWHNGVVVFASTGSSLSRLGLWRELPPNTLLDNWGDFLADVNGDGKHDMIEWYNGVNNTNFYVYVWLSTGTSFTGRILWLQRTGGPEVWGFADVTGDLKADAILAVSYNNALVYRSTGTAFSTTREVWRSDEEFGGTEASTFLADITGDGKVDAIDVQEYSLLVNRAIDCNTQMTFNYIPPRVKTTLRATNSITFLPGVLIPEGTTLSAKIESCENTVARMASMSADERPQLDFREDVKNSLTDERGIVLFSPNPASDVLNLLVKSEMDGQVDIEMFSASNSSVLKTSTNVVRGTNRLIFDVRRFEPGLYIIKTDLGSFSSFEKVVIQR